MLEWNINSAIIKPKYTQLISSCPAPLSFSFPVSSHHPIFLSSTLSSCSLFILLISMPCNFLSHRDHNSFSERAKISKTSHSKFNPKCVSVPFRRHLFWQPFLGAVWCRMDYARAVNRIHNPVQQRSKCRSKSKLLFPNPIVLNSQIYHKGTL